MKKDFLRLLGRNYQLNGNKKTPVQ